MVNRGCFEQFSWSIDVLSSFFRHHIVCVYGSVGFLLVVVLSSDIKIHSSLLDQPHRVLDHGPLGGLEPPYRSKEHHIPCARCGVDEFMSGGRVGRHGWTSSNLVVESNRRDKIPIHL